MISINIFVILGLLYIVFKLGEMAGILKLTKKVMEDEK